MPKLSVLFVDDEENNRMVFDASFDKYFEILYAGSGDEALEVLKKNIDKIGVVVSDQRMPGMRGTDLLEIVQRNWPNIGRVIITAHEDPADIASALNNRTATTWMFKSWDSRKLRRVIEWALEDAEMSLPTASRGKPISSTRTASKMSNLNIIDNGTHCLMEVKNKVDEIAQTFAEMKKTS